MSCKPLKSKKGFLKSSRFMFGGIFYTNNFMTEGMEADI